MRFLLILISLSFNVYSKTKFVEVNNLIDELNYKEYLEWIDLIQQKKDIPTYLQLPQVDERVYQFYKGFDEKGYLKGLKSQVSKKFSLKQLAKLNIALLNPFISKIINSRLNAELFIVQNGVNANKAFSVKLKQYKLSKYRTSSLESIFNGLGYANYLAIVKKQIVKAFKQQEKVSVLVSNKDGNKDTEDKIVNQKYKYAIDQQKIFLVNLVQYQLLNFSDTELNELQRLLKDKDLVNLITVINVYHWLYLDNFLIKKKNISNLLKES